MADDSPETIMCFYTLGIQHPPGYALNTLLGKIFLFIPTGSVMFRAGLMASFFNIFTAVLVFLIAVKIFSGPAKKENDVFMPLLASVMYFFCGDVFLHGLSAKGSVYALHAFIVAAIVLSLYNSERGPRYLYIAAFLYGLSMGNHWQSSAAFLPALMIAGYPHRRMLGVKRITAMSFFFLSGVSVLLFIPLRSAAEPVIYWGPVNSLAGLFSFVGREQYAYIEQSHTAADSLRFVSYYIRHILPGQWPFLLAFAMLPGAVLMVLKKGVHGIVAIAAITGVLLAIALKVVIEPGRIWITRPYLVFSYIFVSILAAYFFKCVIEPIKPEMPRRAAAAVLTTSFACFLTFAAPDYSKYFLAYDYARNLKLTLPDECVYFAEGDLNINSALYLDVMENKKVNLVVSVLLEQYWYREKLAKNPAITVTRKNNDYYSDLNAMLYANAGRRVFYSNAYKKGTIPYPLEIRGITHEVMVNGDGAGNKDPYKYFTLYSLRGNFAAGIKYDDATRVFLTESYGKGLVKLAKESEAGYDSEKALFYYERAFLFYEDANLAEMIGIMHQRKGDFRKADDYFKKSKALRDGNI